MKKGDLIKIIYTDGRRSDGTEHTSTKSGEYLRESLQFIHIKVNKKEIMIPIARIIRMEKNGGR